MGKNDEIYQKRDLIMQKILDNSEYLKDKIDDQKIALDIHKAEDKETHKKIDDKINWGIKIGIIVLIIVAANGGMSAIKALFHI